MDVDKIKTVQCHTIGPFYNELRNAVRNKNRFKVSIRNGGIINVMWQSVLCSWSCREKTSLAKLNTCPWCPVFLGTARTESGRGSQVGICGRGLTLSLR